MWNKLSGPTTMAFIVLVAPLQATAQSQPTAPPEGYYWPGPWLMWDHGYGWPFSWWMCLMMMMLLMIFICVAMFFVARGAFTSRPRHWERPSQVWSDPSQSALQILSERFARGEIQEDEYMQKKLAILSGGPQ